ncbi:Putative formate dehydrogenase SH0748 [Geodia barretti]|uniref:NADH-ubiquinone oxidoreductase 75 kDa subunit, mitochondrial n=1 Tax=Geodia barretti TaxID=519541 RepID=A0AA35WJU7_GEOBA|nr:Putative formate dehydrogenase SH0748 [Geodia barretti]
MGITLSINGHPLEVSEGATVLDAINQSGTYISQLCKDPDMKPIGACRTCLVQIEGTRGYPASCAVPVTEGMSVWTDTPEVQAMRKGVLELTLAMFPSNGAAGSKDYKELSIAADRHGITDSRWQGREREAVDSSNPVFNIAMESCILCQRCVQACQDGHQFIGAIDLLGTSTQGRIGTFAERPLLESVCTTCGQCLSVCPTGAIEVKTPPLKVAKEVTTTCPYCGVGCGIKAQVDDTDRIVAMLDDPDNQSSIGMLCVKGRFGYSFVNHEDRLTTPLIRKDGILTEASWDEALEYAAVNLASGATSNSYQDYEEAGCLVIIGSDANSNHPVAASRMRRAVIERGAKLIVINPRRIEMCDFAELWLRPRPGTDVALLNAMAKVILDEDLVDWDFVSGRTEDFEEWRELIDNYTLDYAESITGVAAEDIAQAARIYAKPPFSGSCLIWGMGITQHMMGTANAHSLLNLSFVAGQLGKPGSGISPLRGQNNVQAAETRAACPMLFPATR